MYYYSVGFCWTNNGHKWKQACEPFLTNENTEGRGKQQHLYIYIFAFTLWFNPEIFTEKTIIKRSCFSYNTEIHTSYTYDFKQVIILLIFNHNCQAIQRIEDVLGHCKKQGLRKQFVLMECLLCVMQCRIPSSPLPHHLKKGRHLKNMSWYYEKNTIWWMASLAMENPQFDSTLSGWITSNLSISVKEAVIEIFKTNYLIQLIILCKHINQLFLFMIRGFYIYVCIYTHI